MPPPRSFSPENEVENTLDRDCTHRAKPSPLFTRTFRDLVLFFLSCFVTRDAFLLSSFRGTPSSPLSLLFFTRERTAHPPCFPAWLWRAHFICMHLPSFVRLCVCVCGLCGHVCLCKTCRHHFASTQIEKKSNLSLSRPSLSQTCLLPLSPSPPAPSYLPSSPSHTDPPSELRPFLQVRLLRLPPFSSPFFLLSVPVFLTPRPLLWCVCVAALSLLFPSTFSTQPFFCSACLRVCALVCVCACVPVCLCVSVRVCFLSAFRSPRFHFFGHVFCCLSAPAPPPPPSPASSALCLSCSALSVF